MDIQQLDTPLAIVDLEMLEENILRLQSHLDHFGISNWPHIKTHKIPEIAHLQINAGSKVLSSDTMGLVGFGLIIEYPEAVIYQFSEEHGHVDFSAHPQALAIGEKVTIIPNHVCAVSNLFNEIVTFRNNRVEVVCPVAAWGMLR